MTTAAGDLAVHVAAYVQMLRDRRFSKTKSDIFLYQFVAAVAASLVVRVATLVLLSLRQFRNFPHHYAALTPFGSGCPSADHS